MFNFNYINTKVPAEGLKHKRGRKSLSFLVKYEQKSQVENLPLDSQPNQT